MPTKPNASGSAVYGTSSLHCHVETPAPYYLALPWHQVPGTHTNKACQLLALPNVFSCFM